MTLSLTRRLSAAVIPQLFTGGIGVIAFRLNLHHFITRISDNQNEKMRRKVKKKRHTTEIFASYVI